MARLIVLGSAAAVSNADHDNTHFILHGDHGSIVLVDCGSNPLSKFKRCGIAQEHMRDVILTHFHPDHVAGFPIMLMQLWLIGRKAPLNVYGLHHCITRTEDLMASYQWETWPHFFPVYFCALPERDNTLVLDNDDFLITAWPTRHFIPTIGIRIEVKNSGRVISYSGDTESFDGMVALAKDADLLLHESAGARPGHSSAAQAGEIAAAANVKRLALIHYDVRCNAAELINEARATFSGVIEVAEDYTEYDI